MNKLAEAITKAHNGEVILHPKVAARVLQNIRKDYQEDSIIYTELTEREMDVLKLIANGYSNNKIAEELVISQNTVKGHVSNILSKLHLADRTQAAVFAWQQGIVKRDPPE
jgi:NarL family two-component system response regulator LiaR